MKLINLHSGTTLKFGGETVRIERIADFDTVVVSDGQQRIQRVPLVDILRSQENQGPASDAKLDPTRQAKVNAYAKAFANVLDPTNRNTRRVKEAANILGISLSSAYRALSRYDASGSIDELPPPTRPGGRGKSRIDPEAEKVIQHHLKTKHPGPTRVSRSLFIRKLKQALHERGLTVADGTLWTRLNRYDPGPPRNTRRNRSQGLPTKELLSAYYPATQRPLEIVQVDHWRADAEIVSEDRLSVIGRFTLTIGIDVHTRMIYCAHVGLHAPGSIPFGLAMINGMTRKHGLAERLGIDLTLPMAGVPKTFHLDNAGEFTGNMVEEACRKFSIRLSLRPVESAEYGCHIERLLGTFATRFKSLPGATGANVHERSTLEPELTAAMTLEEMERQIWLLIEEYHHTPHSALGGKTPLGAYQSHFFDNEGQIRQLPKFFADDINLWLYWWPVAYRTIRRTGVRYDELDYLSDELGPLLRRKDDWGQRKFEIRIDPLTAKHIYLKHPDDSNRWLKLDCKMIAMPDVSHDAVKDAIKQARAERRKPVPAVILEILKRQERNVADAKKLTKTAKRKAEKMRQEERMRHHQEKISTFGAAGTRPQPASFGSPSKPSQETTFLKESQVSLDERLAQISDEDIDNLL
ncbi:MAG: Transposon Tn7 transposition protein TnsB [Chloroflexi bacterium]|nr:Transposon Tn7 transposition protein TnsB [Chloroflexota bacterium]